MSRLTVLRFMTWLAFALVLVVPLRARAAIVPACEDDAVSRITPAPSNDEPSCTIVTTVDEASGETSAAPICDPRGASNVAPPRILAVSDARIDATIGCGDDGNAGPSVRSPSHDSAPVGELCGPPQYAVLVPAPELPANSESVLIPATPVLGGPRAGVVRRVDHPPR